ncbi:MAG: hypothetical protein EBT69_08290 [Verrucomicrobia bacterium]|nr:hypothetical protein [Verrucomicrobiota bacterium]
MADEAGGENKGTFLNGEDLSSNDPGQGKPLDQAKADKQKEKAGMGGQGGQKRVVERALQF